MKRTTILLILSLTMLLMIGCLSTAASDTPTPIVIPPTQGGPDVGGSNGPDSSMLGEIDSQLNDAMSASIAFNDAPEQLNVDDTVFLTLLLSPSLTPEELAQEISENSDGLITTDSIYVTPFMRADLQSDNPDAFKIVALPEAPEQLVSTIEPTRWAWGITALKTGDYTLRLTISRMVVFQGDETWRPVKSYVKDMHVSVTFQQRLAKFDWKWLIGLLLTAILPIYWRWQDKRNKEK